MDASGTYTYMITVILMSSIGIWKEHWLPLDSTLGLFFVQAIADHYLSNILKQPKVIFEIIGGIFLGPSVLGHYEAYLRTLFPGESMVYLEFIADIGLVLYLFLVGIEIDASKLIRHHKKAWTVAFSGIVVPFGAALIICPSLYTTFLVADENYSHVQYWTFTMFIATSISVTAFPVLARILKEKGIMQTEVGVISLGAAAVEEVISWVLVILAVSIANAGNMLSALFVLFRVLVFSLILLYPIRRGFQRLVGYVENGGSLRSVKYREHLFAATVVLVMLSSWLTELLGVHAIFGSFLLGLVVPRKTRLWRDCTDRIEGVVHVVFLPLYFAMSGLKTDIAKIDSMDMFRSLLVVCGVACMSKLVACGVPAWLHGLSLRRAAVVGVLMNTRGLMELIVLNLGIECGVLNVRVFTIMIFMTVFTTILTSPAVECLFPERSRGLSAVSTDDGEDSGDETTDDLEILRPSHGIDWSCRISRISVLVESTLDLVDYLNVLLLLSPTVSPYVAHMTALSPPELLAGASARPVDTGSLSDVEVHATTVSSVCEVIPEQTPRSESRELHAVLSAVGTKLKILSADLTSRALSNSANLFAAFNMPQLVLIPWNTIAASQSYFHSVLLTSPAPTAFICQNGALTPSGRNTNSIREALVFICGSSSDAFVLSVVQYIAFHHPTLVVSISVYRYCVGTVFDDRVEMLLERLHGMIQAGLLPRVFLRESSRIGTVAGVCALEMRRSSHDLVICGYAPPPILNRISNPLRGDNKTVKAESDTSESQPQCSLLGSAGDTLHDSGASCLMVVHRPFSLHSVRQRNGDSK